MLQSRAPMLSGLDCLLQAPFLAGIDIAELERIPLRRVELAAGEWVFTPRSRSGDLFFVADGEVELLAGDRVSRLQPIGRALPGDILGEHRRRRRPPNWAARPVAACVVYRWPQSDLEAFLEEHPESEDGLAFLADTRSLASRLRPSWLGENEVIEGLARRHPAVLVRRLLLPAILISAGLGAAAAGGLASSGAISAGGAALAVFGVVLAIWRALDWRNDFYVVTDRRVIWLEKVIGLYDNRVESPLRMILSVAVDSGLTGRQLGYGDVEVRTYTGAITFEAAPHPEAIAATVEAMIRRLQHQSQQDDRQVIHASLRQRLETGPPAEPARPLRDARVEEERDPAAVGLDRWGFESRFVDGGVITYRKHIAVLGQALILPSLLFLAVAGLGIASASGWLGATTWSAFYPVLGVSAAAALLWWLYEYADWTNELFQVTPTHIVSVHRRPLGRETRKVAPLENILGTEVDRRGPIGVLFNFGDVVATVGNETFVFDGLLNPSAAQQDIVRAQEALVDKKQRSDRQRRQDEMVEWLAAYHEQTSPPPPPDSPDRFEP